MTLEITVVQYKAENVRNQEKIFAIAHYSWRGVWTEETVNGSSGADTDSQ